MDRMISWKQITKNNKSKTQTVFIFDVHRLGTGIDVSSLLTIKQLTNQSNNKIIKSQIESNNNVRYNNIEDSRNGIDIL